jgi:predicted porin
MSGQINKQLSSVDNGNESALAVMDNSNSGSRFRFTGEEDIGGGLKVGGVWEWQWQNTPSSGSEFNAAGQIEETSATGLQDRKTELYFAAKWGKVSLGKGDGAGNGAAEVDLSGTTVIDYASANSDQLGGFNFTTPTDVSGPGTGPTVSSMASSFDMFSRNDRIRYDTPKLAKWLTISASRGQANLTEIAVRASGTIGSTRIAAALATGKQKDQDLTTTAGAQLEDDEREVMAISGSALLKNGLNFTVSMSSREDTIDNNPSRDQTWSYFKVGYKTGKHAVSLAMGQREFDGFSPTQDDANPTSVALAYVYKIAKDVELYAAYRDVDADDATATGLDGVSSITVGSRIKWK